MCEEFGGSACDTQTVGRGYLQVFDSEEPQAEARKEVCVCLWRLFGALPSISPVALLIVVEDDGSAAAGTLQSTSSALIFFVFSECIELIDRWMDCDCNQPTNQQMLTASRMLQLAPTLHAIQTYVYGGFLFPTDRIVHSRVFRYQLLDATRSRGGLLCCVVLCCVVLCCVVLCCVALCCVVLCCVVVL
jgi:hypothetical protein